MAFNLLYVKIGKSGEALAYFASCAEHGTNLAGASPVTGIYRQV